jgi:SAM-dependent methyltransferase
MNEWEEIYSEGKQIVQWPWSDLISYVMRYGDIKKGFKILELGSGTGANIPFFLSLGVDYYGIEQSQTAVDYILSKYPNVNVRVGDFCREINYNVEFDLICDRAAVTHNTTEDIKKCLELVHNKLKINGKYIGIDWFSIQHSDYNPEDNYFIDYTNDIYSCFNFQKGQFKDVGIVHFSSERHLKELLSKFNIRALQEKIIYNIIPNNTVASFNFVVQKF